MDEAELLDTSFGCAKWIPLKFNVLCNYKNKKSNILFYDGSVTFSLKISVDDLNSLESFKNEENQIFENIISREIKAKDEE